MSVGNTWSKPFQLEGTYGHYIWRAATHDGKAYLCARRKRGYTDEKIAEMRDKLNLQTLLVWSHFPGVEHEAAMASVRLFTEEVMPRFAEPERAAAAAE